MLFRSEAIQFGLSGRISRILLDGSLQRTDPLGQLLLLRAKFVIFLLRLTSLTIQLYEPVDEFDILAPTTLRFPQDVGRFAKHARIDHA